MLQLFISIFEYAAVGTIFGYQLAVLYHFEYDQELCAGFKTFLKAA